jgi:hypothetical protein
MSTFTALLVVSAVALLVAACEQPYSPVPGSASAASTSGNPPSGVAPPSPQPSPMAVVVGPSGLHTR